MRRSRARCCPLVVSHTPAELVSNCFDKKKRFTYVFIVPDLSQHSITRICAILTSFRGIVSRSRATDEWHATSLCEKGIANGGVCVGCAIRRRDVRGFQPSKGGKALVVLDRRVEEVNHFLVFAILRAVACYFESGVAVKIFV